MTRTQMLHTGRVGSALRVLSLAMLAAFIPALGGCSNQPKFSSPEGAVDAMVASLRPLDVKRLDEILGSGAEDIVSSGDDVADQNRVETFLTAYDRKHEVVTDEDTATLLVGDGEWPLPIPIVRGSGGWRFDTEAGKDEVLSRRIGRNELATIQVCLAVVDAQREYAERHPMGGSESEYASKFFSDEGQRNGLYWPVAAGEEPSPLGELVASAQEEGYSRSTDGQPHPYHGYLYRMLTAQGPDAPGGAMDYQAGGHLTGGFAVLAYPADYGNSGIMSFLVNQNGIVYQRDLGKSTVKTASALQAFNPGEGWEPVEDDARPDLPEMPK